MQSNENRIRKKSKENKPTGVSLASEAPPALSALPSARWPYLHDFKLYISEIPICRAPTLRYEMKRNKTRTTRHARKKSKSKLKIKGFSEASEGGGCCNFCGRHSMQFAIKTCTERLHINMCGRIDWNWICVGGGGPMQESKVSTAKTVIGFAWGRLEPHRSQLNFVCTCVAGD